MGDTIRRWFIRWRASWPFYSILTVVIYNHKHGFGYWLAMFGLCFQIAVAAILMFYAFVIVPVMIIINWFLQ